MKEIAIPLVDHRKNMLIFLFDLEKLILENTYSIDQETNFKLLDILSKNDEQLVLIDKVSEMWIILKYEISKIDKLTFKRLERDFNLLDQTQEQID